MAPNDVKTIVGSATTQALLLAAAASGSIGPSGIPGVLLFGAGAVLINLFTPDSESALQVSGADFQQAMQQMATHISDVNARGTADNAVAMIRTAYEWYAQYNARVVGGEQFTQKDLDEIRTGVLDALGPNSGLIQGLNILADVRVGKFACVAYALGASLVAKLGLIDIGVQVNRGETIALAQWRVLATRVGQLAAHLKSLTDAVDAHGFQKLKEWSEQRGYSYTQQQWLDQRDKVLLELWGDDSKGDSVKRVYYELLESSIRYEALAKAS